MKNHIQIPLAALFTFFFVSFSINLAWGEIEVKDLKGRKMKIDVLSYTQSSGNVRIKRLSDNAMFNVKISVFDPESQKKIKEVAPKAKAKLLAKVSVGRRRQNVRGSSYMERQTITAKATIENESRDIDFIEGKATVFLVAREMRRFSDKSADYGKILKKESFHVTVNPGREFKYECKPVVTEYDSDRDETNLGGWEYYGWMLIVEDKDGDVLAVETSIGNLKKEVDVDPRIGEVFLQLTEGKLVEKNLSVRKR